ncbi:MAG TPA: OmpH family outer membrane protein [Methylomirabilota bacterium]|jgi:outer membrane protein|nr:OmpH family outer membrane protein [Methylomirabilota bacterium]
MKRLAVLVTALAAVLVLAGDGGAAASRIGFVDVQKVLVRSVAGVAAREQLEREKAAMQKDVDTRRAEVEKLRDELEKKGLVLSADSKREKEETLQRKVRDLRRVVDDFQKELERKEQALTQRILQDLTVLIERVGKERGYLLILEKRGASVIYGDAEADVTEDVIKFYDQEKAKEKK